MKKFFLLLIIFINISLHFAFAATGKTNKPIDLLERPFLASIPALFLHPTSDFSPEEETLTLYPERSELPRFGDRNRLTYTLALQEDSSAPLVFILPGTGGFANAPTTLYLAEQVFRKGYSVITLPSTTHWSFAIAASENGRTGFLPNDAKALYRLMHYLKLSIIDRRELKPSHYGLVGYSNGALESAFLSRQDQWQKIFQFQFAIMINPPLNREIAVTKLDTFLGFGAAFSKEKMFNLMGFAQGRFLDVLNGQRDISTPAALHDAFPLKEKALAWIMSAKFRDSLEDSAWIGELINENNEYGRSIEKSDVMPRSLTEYLDQKVFTNLRERSYLSLAEIKKQCELSWALEKTFETAKKTGFRAQFYLFHSHDDFLSFPENSNQIFSPYYQTFLQTGGGHLGNMLSPEFKIQFDSVLEQNLKARR